MSTVLTHHGGGIVPFHHYRPTNAIDTSQRDQAGEEYIPGHTCHAEYDQDYTESKHDKWGVAKFMHCDSRITTFRTSHLGHGGLLARRPLVYWWISMCGTAGLFAKHGGQCLDSRPRDAKETAWLLAVARGETATTMAKEKCKSLPSIYIMISGQQCQHCDVFHKPGFTRKKGATCLPESVWKMGL
jgi:hypothetical protein